MAKSYFSHDSNARNDEKIIRVRMKHGAAGYGVYFMLIERMRDEDGYSCSDDYDAIAFDLRVDAELVRSVVEDFGLFTIDPDSGRIYSESFQERMKSKDDIANARREAGKKGNEKRWVKKSDIANASEDGRNCDNKKSQIESQIKDSGMIYSDNFQERTKSKDDIANASEDNRKCDNKKSQTEDFAKEIDRNKIKVNLNNLNNITSQQNAGASACVEGDFFEELRHDTGYIEVAAMQCGISIEDVSRYIEKYKAHLVLGDVEHNSRQDFRSHFRDWLNIQVRTKTDNNNGNTNRGRSRRRTGVEVDAHGPNDYRGKFNA